MSKIYIIQNKKGETVHLYGHLKYQRYIKQGWKLIATVWGLNMQVTHEREGDRWER